MAHRRRTVGTSPQSASSCSSSSSSSSSTSSSSSSALLPSPPVSTRRDQRSVAQSTSSEKSMGQICGGSIGMTSDDDDEDTDTMDSGAPSARTSISLSLTPKATTAKASPTTHGPAEVLHGPLDSGGGVCAGGAGAGADADGGGGGDGGHVVVIHVAPAAEEAVKERQNGLQAGTLMESEVRMTDCRACVGPWV